MKYKIVEVDAAQHSVVVRFYSDTITEDQLAIQRDADGSILRCSTDFNVMLPHPVPIGAALTDYIVQRAPIEWLQILEKIVDPEVDTTLSQMIPLIGVITDFQPNLGIPNTNS